MWPSGSVCTWNSRETAPLKHICLPCDKEAFVMCTTMCGTVRLVAPPLSHGYISIMTGVFSHPAADLKEDYSRV